MDASQRTDEPAAKRDRREEAPQNEPMETGAAHPPPSSTPELHASSAFEGLPRELLFKVVEYVPEAAMEMRLASKMLAYLIDAYAKGINIPMVSRMTFGDFRLPGSTTPDSHFGIMYSIEPRTRGLFYRRLYLLEHEQGDKKISLFEAFKQLRLQTMDESEKKTYEDKLQEANEKKEKGEEYTMPVVPMLTNISMKFNLDSPENDAQLKLFAECLGRRLKFVQVVQTTSDLQFDNMEKVLVSKQIGTMKVCTADLHDANITHLFRVVMMHNVDGVEFGVTKFDSEMKTDLLGVLRELATQVRRLKICQYNNNDANNAGAQAGTFLFGKQSADWPTLFIDMLSEKLDTLVIENKHNMDYLNELDAVKLKERLPELKKSIWFEASCDKFENGFKKEENGFAIEADKKDAKGSLRIKHVSRGPLEPVKTN